jgi:predicted GH43/DUF377 family glycosyl hydrolase
MAALKKKKIKKVVVKKKVKTVKQKIVVKKRARKNKTPLDLKKSNHNPIIEPESHVYWGSKATFNPSAIYHDGKIHIIYRAIGNSDISVLGYAKSDDGYSFDKQSREMAFYSRDKFSDKKFLTPKINYASGGGWGGGCEDPRLTLLGDRVYMLYTAFDGWGSLRIALTSISLDDFVSRRWNWKEPVLISPPGEIHKNWVLFPEKIGGKYAILHSISPHVMIDYFNNLDELDEDNFIHSVHQGSLLWGKRDKLIRGVGPAPIKIKYGWLVLYHKMEKHETHRYKLWAMILDAKDPTKILNDSSQPILEPDEWYENEGYKGGVVYSCGAVVKDGELFVYYGGADKVSCVATANLDKFLEELVHQSVSKLKSKKIKA